MSLHQIPVRGAALAVDVLPGDTEPVLAIHGLTSNRRLWNWLRAEDRGITLVAPDLRGRADSVAIDKVAAPHCSVDQHVEDLVTVLDVLGIRSAVVCGMSLGGFVGVALAARYPERVARLVLVDGGLPMATAPGGGAGPADETAIRAALAPQLERQRQRYPSAADYVGAAAPGLPLLPADDPLLADCLGHDLDPTGTPRLDVDVALDDAVSVFVDHAGLPELTVPTRLIHAEWSVGPDSPPAYPADRVDEFRTRLPSLQHVERVDGSDHAAVVMSRAGAAVVARHLRAALDEVIADDNGEYDEAQRAIEDDDSSHGGTTESDLPGKR